LCAGDYRKFTGHQHFDALPVDPLGPWRCVEGAEPLS
jgi:hypothetical protein